MQPTLVLRQAFHKLPLPVQSTIRQVLSPVVRRVMPPALGLATGQAAGEPGQAVLDHTGPIGGTRLQLAAEILAALPAIEGWCTERKAVWLADLIAENGCSRVLEIGIFGGKSLIPMALAVRECVPGGKVWGVEAWSNDVAVETPTNAVNDAWWRQVELEAIKAGFLRNLLDNELAGIVNVLEMSSDEAFTCLTAIGLHEFDLIHVDGSHSEVQALRDVKMWSGLLRPGGILVLDDILWASVQRARDYLKGNFAVIEEVVEPEGAAYGAYRRRD